MNFRFDRFLKPLTSSDKNIKIYDNNNIVKYIINPFNVKTLNISNNLIYIHLESGRNMTLDFSTQNETKQAVQKLQLYVDTLKNSLVPYYIQHAVEIEAPNFTKGPTGSVGLTGSVGETGLTGERGESGKSAYDVWLSSNTGTQEEFFNSLIGPIGATGPMMFGNTDELEVVGQSILATQDNKDIEIVTKGAGNLLFKIDRDGWLLKFGFMRNTNAEIWGSGSAIDDEGNIYTTGADYLSVSTYIIKTGKNGLIIWQKQVDFYSQGESIVFSNNHIYILANNLDFAIFPQIIKMDKNGNIINVWDFEIHIDELTTLPDYMFLSEIAVDEEDNIYYVGSQYNAPTSFDVNYGLTDMVVGKFNTNDLSTEWFKVINGGNDVQEQDNGSSIKYKNGFVYVSGTVFNDYNGIKGDAFVTKINKDGAISWSKVIGSNTYTEGTSLTIDDDHFIYLSGYYSGSNFRNYYMKLDSNGDTVWSKSINKFNRYITSIEENGIDSLFILSTQGISGNPQRQSTDLYLAKISKADGSITWQQYIYTDYRDSIWALLPSPTVFPATGHRSLVIDPSGKSVYITGLTVEGDYSNEEPVPPGATNSEGFPLINDFPSGFIGIYHNAFLMSYDQKSLPEGPYGNWNIQTATFSTSDLVFDYNITSSNTSVDISETLKDTTTPFIYEGVGNINESIKQHELTLFSPNTELYVKGIITIDDLYTLPRKAGTTGQILTYGNSGTLLEWKLPTVTFGFNDYVEIENNLLGTASMDGIFVDPILGTVSETYQFQFDDRFFTVDLPIGFEVSFMGVSYSTIYVGSNSFITFGSGYSNSGGYTKNNPSLPGIFLGAFDRSCQALYTKETADQFVIRYEGSVSPNGPQTQDFVEIEWEITFNKNSSIIDVIIGNFDPYFEFISTGNGLSVIKNTNEIYKELTLIPNTTAFRILKGYGYRPVQANRLNYLNIEGLSYSVTEDPLNLGDDIINIDFSGLGGSGKFYYQSTAPSTGTLAGIQPGALWYDSSEGYLYIYVVDNDSAQWVTQINNVGPVGPQGNSGSFTTLGTTGSNIFLDSDSIFHISSGIQNGMDQSLYTIESFGSDQGMYLQAELPIMLADQDNILFGIKDSQDNWAYHIKLTYDNPTTGNMVIYDAYGVDDFETLDTGQTYNPSDIFSIYIDGEKVYFKINGITVQSTDFLINPSLSYRFFCETLVGTNPSNTLSVDYNFEKFKFYPTVSVSNRKNLLSTKTKTADYTIALDDYTIRADATINDVTITLPTAASAYGNNKGYEFIIKRVDSSLNNVYLNGDSGQLIDAFSTGGLTFSSLETKRVQSNGAYWDIL
jgi:hypothetical protein